MPKSSAVETSLRKVQQLMRVPGPTAVSFSDGFHIRYVPAHLGKGDLAISYDNDVAAALQAAGAELLADQSFEHLGEQAVQAVWEFACRAFYEKKGNGVPAFLAAHARAVQIRKCYFTIEHLRVSKVETFAGVTLLPPSHPDVPKDHPMFVTEAPVGAVAVVEASGTDFARLAERGRAKVEHALRLLRIALRAHMSINDQQLRFRLGISYQVEGEITGWISPAGTAYELDLDDELMELANSREVASLNQKPQNPMERQADLATKWIEKARFETEPIDALLDLFCALEALLGDTSDGLKGAKLAFRVALLSSVAGDGFTDPGRTFWLYDKVRSYAIHGEEPPAVDEDTVRRFASTVWRTLDLYLKFARERSLTRRSRVIRTLMADPLQPKLSAWLRANAGAAWTGYLDEVDAQTTA